MGGERQINSFKCLKSVKCYLFFVYIIINDVVVEQVKLLPVQATKHMHEVLEANMLGPRKYLKTLEFFPSIFLRTL